MMQGMPQPAYYIFKCQQSAPPGMPKPSCVRHDDPESQQLFQYLAQQLMMKGIIGTVQPVQTGCLGRCQQGPVMLVEPGTPSEDSNGSHHPSSARGETVGRSSAGSFSSTVSRWRRLARPVRPS